MTLRAEAESLNSHIELGLRFLAGRRVLVAGGSGNVGRHIVTALLEAGARVIVTTRTSAKREEIEARHAEASVSLTTLLGDVADEEDGPRLLDEILADGRPLDAAVTSLGAFVPTESILTATRADLARAINGYLMAHHGVARNLIPRLRDSGGRYVMIQGPLAFDVLWREASLVSVATAAQAMLARAIMKEVAAEGGAPPRVRVNELVIHSAVGWDDAGKSSPLEPIEIGRYAAGLISTDIHGRTIHLKSPDQLLEVLPQSLAGSSWMRRNTPD